MKKAKIAVLVSGGGTNLQALLDAQARGELGGGEITAVISTKAGVYALERAAKAGVPGYVIPRKDFDSNRSMTVAMVEKLRELEIDLVVLAVPDHAADSRVHGNFYPGAGAGLSQRHYECAPSTDPVFLRGRVLWLACPRSGAGLRGKTLRRHGPLCQ